MSLAKLLLIRDVFLVNGISDAWYNNKSFKNWSLTWKKSDFNKHARLNWSFGYKKHFAKDKISEISISVCHNILSDEGILCFFF